MQNKKIEDWEQAQINSLTLKMIFYATAGTLLATIVVIMTKSDIGRSNPELLFIPWGIALVAGISMSFHRGVTLERERAAKALVKQNTKPAAKKQTTAKAKPAAKKPAAKKTTAKKPAAKKPAAKKPAAKKTVAKKPAAKKAAAKKPAVKKAPAKKAPVKKTAAKKTAKKS